MTAVGHRGGVSRVITDLGVFDVTGTAFNVIELADGVTYDNVVANTAGFAGQGQDPKPPTARLALSEMSATASAADATTLFTVMGAPDVR